MKDKELVADWQFTRSETLELFNTLNDEALAFKPDGQRWQPVAYQFACIGRTQLVYAKALLEGKMDFAYFGDPMLPSKQAMHTHDDLQKLLTDAEVAWQEALKSGKKEVKWPGSTKSVVGHTGRLIAHERIHHGQLIGYFTLAGWDLPPNFKQNWAL